MLIFFKEALLVSEIQEFEAFIFVKYESVFGEDFTVATIFFVDLF